MKISEAIALTDELKPNQYPLSLKVRWLSRLDGQIFNEVVMRYEGAPEEGFTPYSDENTEAELLVPFPYAEEVYIPYIQSQIDKENGETAKYNQSASAYNSGYQRYTAWYTRNHMPLGGRRFLF